MTQGRTGAVDQVEGAGARAGQLESGLVDAETVAGERVALDRLVIAERVATGQGDLVVAHLQRPGPFHRLDTRPFASCKVH